VPAPPPVEASEPTPVADVQPQVEPPSTKKATKPRALEPATAPPSTVVRRSVTLGAVPWANVTIDNDPTVRETPVTIELAVGSHRVTYANPELGVTRTVTVHVPADGPARHLEDLRPVDEPR